MSEPLPEPAVRDLALGFKPLILAVSRFQRKQYAPIDIVQTEKKGFGLRAAENLPRFVLFSGPTTILALTCVSMQGCVYL